MSDVYQILKDAGVAHGPMPQNCLREGSPLPGGAAGYVFLVLVNRMARKPGRQNYKGQIIELEAGEACCSLRDLAKVTGYTVKVVRTAVQNLKKYGILVPSKGTASKHNFDIFYIDLSLFNPANGHKVGHSKGTVRAQLGHSKGTQIDTAVTAVTADTADQDPPGGTPPNGASDRKVVDIDAELYRIGKKLLGEKAGGQITKLKKQRGIGGTFELMKKAETKENPVEFIAAAISRGPPQDHDRPKAQPRGVSW